VTLVLGLVGSASAVPVTFFGEDLGLGETTPLSSWTNAATAETTFLSNLSGVGTATLQGDGEIETINSGTNGYGRYPISGTNYWETGSSSSFSIGFTSAISAFGFYGIDVGDFNGQLQLEATNGTTETIAIPHTIDAPGGTVIYFGFYDLDQAYSQINFSNTGSSADYFGFDDMTIGTYEQVIPNNPVPEPSTILLMGIGLLGLVGYSRKRSKKS
jgi:hypothetical protein